MANIVIIGPASQETQKLCAEFTRNGIQCLATNDDDTIEQITRHNARLLVVDYIGSPDTEALCHALRRDRELPVIAMLPIEKVDNFIDEVDDFVTKPVNPAELIARAKRLTRKKVETEGQILKVDDMTIDMSNYEVTIGSRLVYLTFKEYQLLIWLATHPGRVFTRDVLLNQIWGQDYFGGDRTVDVHIRRLRSKIEDSNHSFVETVRNIGYRFIKREPV